jgi:anaphase-promoting complex subunit 8
MEAVNEEAVRAARGELRRAVHDTRRRGLLYATKWAAEQLAGLPAAAAGGGATAASAWESDSDVLQMANSYFDLKEYRRAAHVLATADDDAARQPLGQFVRMYALYLAGEKQKEEDIAQSPSSQGVLMRPAVVNNELKALHDELSTAQAGRDGFLLYLLGLVQRGLGMKTEAIASLSESVTAYPCNWSAWQELSSLCADTDTVQRLQLPDHWTRTLFMAQLASELQHEVLPDGVIDQYNNLEQSLFPRSTYILVQKAMVYYLERQYDDAERLFEEVLRRDPYRLEHMDAYSNILYVHEKDAELSFLAHNAIKWDRYRPETCCIIGNYYSRKRQHEKAVQYFSRALKLDPSYLSACTLMGHEFVEMKNHNAAIEAYRRAVDINPRDYRAWYGLGQMYEMLHMHFYALYYFRKVTVLRPNDPRMWCAMGSCYGALKRSEEAKKCFERASRDGGGGDNTALAQLAKLYEADGPSGADKAAHTYRRLLELLEGKSPEAYASEVSTVDLACSMTTPHKPWRSEPLSWSLGRSISCASLFILSLKCLACHYRRAARR